MSKKYLVSASGVSVVETRFLIAINQSEGELYVLHRDFPRCLIFVEQKTPLNFVVFDFFENNDKEHEAIQILTSEDFKNDLRKYLISQSFIFEN